MLQLIYIFNFTNVPKNESIIIPRSAGKEQKSCNPGSTIDPGNTELPAKNYVLNDARLASNLPKDAAVHFGTFYGVQGSNGRKMPAGKMKSFGESTAASRRSTPRLEFTRQMVQK